MVAPMEMMTLSGDTENILNHGAAHILHQPAQVMLYDPIATDIGYIKSEHINRPIAKFPLLPQHAPSFACFTGCAAPGTTLKNQNRMVLRDIYRIPNTKCLRLRV